MTEDLLQDLVQYKTHKNKSKYYMDVTLNSFFSLCYVVFGYSLCGSAVLICFLWVETIFGVWVTSVYLECVSMGDKTVKGSCGRGIDKNKARRKG